MAKAFVSTCMSIMYSLELISIMQLDTANWLMKINHKLLVNMMP